MDPGNLDGRVELREKLGEGGMAEVRAAWDRALDRAVAVKLLHGSGPRQAERILLEARLQARVEHPHVVRVIEVGALQGRPCILLQLVRGRGLGEVAPSLSVAERVELVRQAATGLHAAHQQGLVHRDVKPANILVEDGTDGGSTALVADFGLAHAEEGGLTRSGLLPGTLDFMAPEQLAGDGPVDFRSDVYALGATLYAVLAGRPPFRLPSANPEAGGEEQLRLIRRVLEEEPPPLSSVVPAVPRELSLVCGKAMEKAAEARYPSAAAFAEDLARFQRGEPVQARAATWADRAWRWTRRNPAAARSLAAAIAILLLAGGFTLWQARRAGQEALEAARLGAIASSLESRMRMEYLSPPHDLRPALAEVRREVEALRPLAAARGGGPASFALGKGLELLGDLDGARQAYERAWSLGFRTPQVAEGLGSALGFLYGAAYRRAEETLAGEDRAKRQAALHDELAHPAQRYLERGDAQGWRAPFLRARIALLERDFRRARSQAAEVRALDPTRYEAGVLEGRAWLDEAATLAGADRGRDALERLDEAARALEAALAWGRSDPEALALLAEVELRRGELLYGQGAEQPSTERLEACLALLDRAGALVGERGAEEALRAEALFEKGRALAIRGDRRAVEVLAEANRLRRLLARASPGDHLAQAQLAEGLHYETVVRQVMLGDDGDALLDEGLGAAAAARALAPRDLGAARARIRLLTRVAALRVSHGRAAAELLDEAEALAAQAVREAPSVAPSIEEVLLKALEWRALDEWRAGRDPRPILARARRLAEERLGASQGRLSARTELISLLEVETQLLGQMGLGAARQMELSLTLLEQDLARASELPVALFNGAETLAVEVERRLAAGEDPGPVVARARRLVDRALRRGQALGDVGGLLAQLSFAAASHLASRGRDPRPALDRAEREMGAGSRQPERLALDRRLLAACSLERALWERRHGSDPLPAARLGLARVEAALAADGRDPLARILRSRLLLLAGDRPAARATLDQAYALQPLVKGSADARAAEAEQAALARR